MALFEGFEDQGVQLADDVLAQRRWDRADDVVETLWGTGPEEQKAALDGRETWEAVGGVLDLG